jgi:DUF1009 family protein
MLALISGQGALPKLIAKACTKRPFIAALENFLPNDLVPDLVFRLETLGTFLTDIKKLGITEVCFAGAIRRPVVDVNLIDGATKEISDQLLAAIQTGDDEALRIVIKIFEKFGFKVVGLDQIIPNCFPKPAVLTERVPNIIDENDAKRADAIVSKLSPLDIGQGCVISGNHVLAIETFGGTEWMLKSINSRPYFWPSGGILFKTMKIDQDRRVDIPAIGPDTVSQVKTSGLNGIVLQQGKVVILNVEHVIKKANELDLFIWVRETRD